MRELIESRMLVTLDLPKQMGKWKTYEHCKDSGVEWLGKIPAHWEVRRLKFVSLINTEVLRENVDPDYMLQYVDISNVDSEGKIHDIQELAFRNAPSRARRIIKNGDTILSTVRTYLRAIAYINNPAENLIVSTGFAVLRPRQEISSKFLYRFVQSHEFVNLVVSHSEGVGYPAINPGRLACLPILLPSFQEQRAITAFLDRETTKINELITKKQQMIELLQEQRTAIINQAVTKGLNPDVPMKDSGVEWLGEIPAHWEVRKLKHSIYSIEQGWSPSCENRLADTEEWGVLKVGCVNGIEFNDNEHKALPKDVEPIPELEIKTGDILMSRANTRELLGSASIVRQVRPRLLLCDKLYRFKINSKVLGSEFFVISMKTSIIRFQLERDATGASSSMQNIAQSTILNLILPHLDTKEQGEIVSFLSIETAKLDKLISGIQEGIKKLKEYSTALISAAVTGKIDVHGEIANMSAEDAAI